MASQGQANGQAGPAVSMASLHMVHGVGGYEG